MEQVVCSARLGPPFSEAFRELEALQQLVAQERAVCSSRLPGGGGGPACCFLVSLETRTDCRVLLLFLARTFGYLKRCPPKKGLGCFDREREGKLASFGGNPCMVAKSDLHHEMKGVG